MYSFNNKQTNVLTELHLQKIAPSVFAYTPSATVSDKYSIIPTIDCVRGLQDIGYDPVQASESRCRNEDNAPYVKHMVRFRQRNGEALEGLHPEIVLVNSHNGTSSYQLRAGIYRLVCSNGLIVGNDCFTERVRHTGDIVARVVDSAKEIAQKLPQALQISHTWKGIELTPNQQMAFALTASLLRWNMEEMAFDPAKLLTTRREADKAPDLFTTFNVVQENLIRGGIRYRNGHNRQSTRAVGSVSENTRLNTALWALTEKMAELATK